MRSNTSTLIDCLYIMGDELPIAVTAAAATECADRMALLKGLLTQAMPIINGVKKPCPVLERMIAENVT